MVIEFLVFVGIIFIVLLFVGISLSIFQYLGEFFYKIQRKHEYKHRFDKPPIAECYCIDCIYWYKNKECKRVHRIMADNWFCSEAIPRKRQDKDI